MGLVKEHPAGSSQVSTKKRSASDMTGWAVALFTLFVLLPLDKCFGLDTWLWQPPSDQPEQIKSEVDYEARLTDRFFEMQQWSRPYRAMGGAVCRDGKPVVKYIARCFSTSFNVDHDVRFCEARLLDEQVIELLIHEVSPAFDDQLRIRIRDGEFSSQFWIVRSHNACTWTTTRQKLILNKKVYGKGDLIKGRIDFECLSELRQELAHKFGTRAHTIKIHGVFKTILQ